MGVFGIPQLHLKLTSDPLLTVILEGYNLNPTQLCVISNVTLHYVMLLARSVGPVIVQVL